jgi:RNA polymerase sigma-70 factor (ECF subfamily)
VAAPAPESDERESLMQRAMARLPALQKQLLRAFHFERRSVAEIAAGMGISERGVEGRLRRARQTLRREIESDRGASGGSYDY